MMMTSSNPVDPSILEDMKNLYFRQSMINDFLMCPMMMFYTWVLETEQAPPWMSAVLGTAGHACIFTMHEKRKFNYTSLELLQMMSEFFDEELATLHMNPAIGSQYHSIEEEKMDKIHEYVAMLEGYQHMEKDQDFISSLHEQPFVLTVKDTLYPEEEPYLFTGTIDQGGFRLSGDLILRDIKFRDNAFKPSRNEFMLNTQMTIYAAALKFGNPACNDCRPRYDTGDLGLDKRLVYKGPCDKCKAKIGTPAWPQKFPLRCELVWMRDFLRHEKDQYPQFIKDNTAPKVKNPKGKGPKVFPEVENPKWGTGYHAGDIKGQGYIPTGRTPSDLQILMGDILAACRSIRKGEIFRKPGDACSFWCKHTKSCHSGIESKIKVSRIADDFTNPFDSM